MTKEKWLNLYDESLEKALSGQEFLDRDPGSWTILKPKLLTFIKEVDKATEVFNMENDNVNS